MTKAIIEYVWVSEYGIVNTTKILPIDVRRFDGLGSYFGTTPRLLKDKDVIPPYITEKFNIIAKSIYKDPFRKDGYIVIGEDVKLPTRSVLQQTSDPNLNPSLTPMKKGSEYTIEKTFYGDTTLSDKYYIFEEYLNRCLDVDVCIDRIDYTVLTPCCIFNSVDPIKLADDCLISQYIFRKVVANNKLNPFVTIKTYYKMESKILTISQIKDPYSDLTELLRQP